MSVIINRRLIDPLNCAQCAEDPRHAAARHFALTAAQLDTIEAMKKVSK